MTDQTTVFQLERFYVAITSQDGQTPQPSTQPSTQAGTQPGVQLLARTPGIRPEHVAECTRAANLTPPPWNQQSEAMPASFGLFRGDTVDYILAKAQTGAGGQAQIHYLIVPSLALRRVGGNLYLFEPFAKEPIPSFPTQRMDLPTFTLDNPHPPSSDTQTDDLLKLITFCKNDLKTVGGLLAGLVQAMGIGIINAPPSLHDRITFVQGLLAMLPVPARVAITFATSVVNPAQTNTQIKFLTSDVRPERHLIFDWSTGKLLQDPPEDVYSKFILAQLRLDTSLVLEQTERLARTAVWRAMRKDDMANALGWASRRASLDGAVENNLPADRNLVAAVLREDPTLPDEMRVKYTRHLLALSLALDDPASTDIVPMMSNQNQEVADAAYAQLETAIQNDQALAVYHLLERWITQQPMGVDVSRWRPLVETALLLRNNKMLFGEAQPLAEFLESFLTAPASMQVEPVVAKMIALSRKRGHDNPDVARAVFLLGMSYLPLGGLQRLLTEVPLTAQLPEPLREAILNLVPSEGKIGPPEALSKASFAFGPQHQPIILARLIEWAVAIQRLDLVDVNALRGLIAIAQSPHANRFENIIQFIIQDMGRLEVLQTADPEIPERLTQLNLVRGRYGEAILQMEFVQNNLYKATQHTEMADYARSVFRDVPLPSKAVNEALQAMEGSQLQPITRASAYIGALEGKNWSNEVEPAARRLTALLFADPRLAEMTGTEPILRLLKANADRKDGVETLRVATALIEYALHLGEKGTELVFSLFPVITWDSNMSKAAVELLRTYIRRAPLHLAKDLPRQFGAKYGEPVERALDVAHRVRLVIGGIDFVEFTERVHAATSLLTDMASSYHPSRDLPPLHKLRRSVEGMPGGLSDEQCARLASNLTKIGLNILQLTQIPSKKRTETGVHQTQLIKGQTPPTTGLDALRWIGGHYSEGDTFTLRLDGAAPAHLLGNRSLNILFNEAEMITSLFEGLLQAFPEKDTVLIDNAVWAAEIDSLWALLTLYTQRHIQPSLGEEAQLLPQVIRAMAEKGNERIFQDGGYGKQLYTGRAQPKTAMEALRWVSGYFARMHD
jgi:hypothetical protein